METILVVDNDPRMVCSVRDLLDSYGYECITANGGAMALELLAQQPIDLILLDLNMPDVSGYYVLKEIATKYPNTNAIIISGYSCAESAPQLLRSGANDFLRKPYAPDELIQAIENIANKRRAKRKLNQQQQLLEDSEQHHRFIVNNSPDVVYMLDDKGVFNFLNERVESLLGYKKNELIGVHYSNLIHNDDLEKIKYAFSERRTGSRASHNLEFRLLRKPANTEADDFEHQTIPAELSAMGVYSNDNQQSDKVFVGTYGVVRDISERKRAEELVNFQLYHDLLTKLPNRALFRDRLTLAIAQAKRNENQLAVMYLDMDRFKIINDSLGHLIGDQLLQSVAIKLRSCLRDSDTLARVGGDEFNLLLPNINLKQDAATIARKILVELEKPMELEGVEVFISFSIGIAIFPQDGDTIDSLIKHADTAMYHVKEHGKKNFEFYDAEMRTKHGRHLSLETGLRNALELDQFRIFYQPQIDVESGNVVGVEALLRWDHPEEGLIMPNDFIPLSEEIGMINLMGRWVLNNACMTVKEWSIQGLPEVKLAINISARELVQPDFPDYVIDILKNHKLSSHQLEIEVTENVLMRDMDQTVTKLRRLADFGVQIAVDDFGTGYSSLGYLQTLPLNTLKIDRSFVSEIRSSKDSNTIIYAIASMAKGLGLNLVAEGVETKAQLGFLKRVNCPVIQGYLTGPPRPADEVWENFSKAMV